MSRVAWARLSHGPKTNHGDRDGVYLYDADNHALDQVLDGDHRSEVMMARPPRPGEPGQPGGADGPPPPPYPAPSNPPVQIILVSDSSRFKMGPQELRYEWGAIDAGIVSQNISLFCAATGIKTRPPASMDKDNGDGWMFDLFVPSDVTPAARFEAGLLSGVTTLTMNGLRVVSSGGDTAIEPTAAEPTLEPVELKAIPYYAWNNRGKANMLVWVSTAKENVFTKAGWGLEMEVTASSSLEWVWGLNTGFDPRSSTDIDKSYYYFWQAEQPQQWVQYDFESPVTLSRSEVYWLQLDRYDGNYRVPAAWDLMIQDAGKCCVPVVTSDPYGLALDRYSVVSFAPVRTSAIRMNVKLQPENSAGILAWKVF